MPDCLGRRGGRSFVVGMEWRLGDEGGRRRREEHGGLLKSELPWRCYTRSRGEDEGGTLMGQSSVCSCSCDPSTNITDSSCLSPPSTLASDPGHVRFLWSAELWGLEPRTRRPARSPPHPAQLCPLGRHLPPPLILRTTLLPCCHPYSRPFATPLLVSLLAGLRHSLPVTQRGRHFPSLAMGLLLLHALSPRCGYIEIRSRFLSLSCSQKEEEQREETWIV